MNPYWPAVRDNIGMSLSLAEIADLAGAEKILELIIEDTRYTHATIKLFLDNIFNDINPELIHRIVRKLLLLDPSGEISIDHYSINQICRKRNILPETIKIIRDNITEEKKNEDVAESLLAGNPAMTPALLIEMATTHSLSPNIINKICSNPSIPESLVLSILDKAVKDNDLMKMGFAIKSGKLSIHNILQIIGDNPDFSLLYCDCQETMREEMSEADHLVFELEQLIDNILAGHPGAPDSELRRLTLSGGDTIGQRRNLQSIVAKNPSIPHDVAQYLTAIDSMEILSSVLNNPSICLAIKEPLLRHEHIAIRKRAVEKIQNIESLSKNFLEETDEDVIDTYLMNPHIDISSYLGRDQQNSLALYLRKDLPGALLRDIIEENSPLAPAILANYSVPKDILWTKIRQEISDTTWRDHAYLAVNPSLDKEMISELANSQDLFTRFLLTLREDLDKSTAVILALTYETLITVE